MQPTYLFTTKRAGLAANILWGCAETPVSGSELGFNSIDSGSHMATRSLSPMTVHQHQWPSLANSNQRAIKQCSFWTLLFVCCLI
jgi:hypothetical protein